ncbi:MAG: hypothetical protein RL173_2042 [Fibrobacterota bacterium]|jgi:hypothetical protein
MRHHNTQDWNRIAEDVEQLGAAKACTLHGIHRSTWYRRLRRPSEGAKAKEESSSLTRSILELVSERPAWGCDRIAYYLTVSGNPVSSPTVQKILIAHGLGRREQREERYPGGGIETRGWRRETGET